LIITLPAPGGGAAAVVKETLTFEAKPSGGSVVSVSEIWFAITETVQLVLGGRSDEGVSVNWVAGVPAPGLGVNDCGDPLGHSSENADAVAVTLSLKLMTTDALTGTFNAPLPGDVPVTDGAVSPAAAVVNENV